MIEKLKQHKEALKGVGSVILTLLVIYAWIYGYFGFVFYLFGFYVAIYIISRLFGTTTILEFLLGAGTLLLYATGSFWLLWGFYTSLKIMFEGSFGWGLLLTFIVVPISQYLIFIILGAIGFILGAPIYWMIEDIEKNSQKNITIDAEHFPELAKLPPERSHAEISRLIAKGLTEHQAKVNLEQDLMEAEAMTSS